MRDQTPAEKRQIIKRMIDLDGCLNFRDLGGHPTRRGGRVRMRQVFRSDALHHVSVADIARLREELRIGDIIDLRSTEELRSEGRGLLAHEPIRFHHLPLFDGDAPDRDLRPPVYDLSDRYFLLAEFAMRQIARVLITLAETAAPAVYHCAAGKDRTGVVSAIILGILEVDDDIIVADYALTQANLDQIIDRLAASEGYQSMLATLPPDTLHAQPQTMISLLQKIRAKYGSARGYAQAAGVAAVMIDRLRDRLVE